jgi:2-(1,2-epoxy-1,2-dihydrophenyl)acetyl-CoA isomerase
MMLGERIPAETALDWGLINRVVDDAALAAEAAALAERLARGPTVALGLIRKLAREAMQAPLGDALADERAAQREAGKTEDFRNAVMAFLGKQAPRFEGK